MLIPFGVFSAAGAGGGASAGSYDLISTTILGSSQASVTFDVSTYASTYKHLQIRMTPKINSGNGTSEAFITFNSDSGSNYSWHGMFGISGTASAGAGTSTTFMLSTVSPLDNSSNTFGAGIVDILDPFSTSKNKTIRTFSGQLDNSNRVYFTSGLWRNTAAVTSVIVTAGAFSWKTGSRFSIYGLKG